MCVIRWTGIEGDNKSINPPKQWKRFLKKGKLKPFLISKTSQDFVLYQQSVWLLCGKSVILHDMIVTYRASTSVDTLPGTFLSISRPKLTNSLSIVFATLSSSVLKHERNVRLVENKAVLQIEELILFYLFDKYNVSAASAQMKCRFRCKSLFVLLPPFGVAIFDGLVQQVLVGRHLGSSQDERRVCGGILWLVLVYGCWLRRNWNDVTKHQNQHT